MPPAHARLTLNERLSLRIAVWLLLRAHRTSALAASPAEHRRILTNDIARERRERAALRSAPFRF